METLYSPPPLNQGLKIVRFGFCAASTLIWGDGGLLFHFILSKIVATSNSKLVTSKSQLHNSQSTQTFKKVLRPIYEVDL